MAEYLKVSVKNGRIRIKGDMTSKHIDDTIRELQKARVEITEKERAAQKARATQVIKTPQIINAPRPDVPMRPRNAIVGEAVVFAIVGSPTADLFGNI